jgi:YfiH family protein
VHVENRQGIALHQFDSLIPFEETVLAGCTGRVGGVSRPPYDSLNLGLRVADDPQAVLENRRRLAAALGVELASFVLPQQVHGGGARVVGSAERGRGALSAEDALPGADALITREPGVVLVVLLADCVPVVLFDPFLPAVGVVHAGWSGTVQHVTRNTVAAMRSQLGSDPATLLAGVGPSIGPASYEVDPEVAERARAEFTGIDIVRPDAGDRYVGDLVRPGAGDRCTLDLWGANVADLLAAGVPRENVEVAGLDTFALPGQFFSHRRRQPTGRFAAFATLRR